ncbi:hypothetical protein N7467_008280 [Penicillium canescens]|nr:hypothetical protein N7467_008280 [Penicillium canescens]
MDLGTAATFDVPVPPAEGRREKGQTQPELQGGSSMAAPAQRRPGGQSRHHACSNPTMKADLLDDQEARC